MKGTALIFVNLVILKYTTGTTPQTFTKCSLSDSACLTAQAQKKLKTFGEGIPELGITNINKLPVGDVENVIDNFLFNWTDVQVTGMKDAVIDNVSVNMELKTLRLLFHTTLRMDFNYIMDGLLLSVFPVTGKGKGHLILNNMQMEMLSVFDIIKDANGKDVMALKKYYYGYDTAGGVQAYFENAYNGDKKKSEIFHNIINDSWRVMKGNFGVSFQKIITSKLFEAVKIYMISYPLEELALYN